MAGLQFHLKQKEQPNRILELRSISDGIAKIRDGIHITELSVDAVVTCTPTRKEDIVVCFAEGEYFGKMFHIKIFGTDKCILCKFGVPKTTYKEKLYDLPTLNLATVYPPRK